MCRVCKLYGTTNLAWLQDELMIIRTVHDNAKLPHNMPLDYVNGGHRAYYDKAFNSMTMIITTDTITHSSSHPHNNTDTKF